MKIFQLLPYGGFNSDTIKILKKSDLKFALTTSVGSVNKKILKILLNYQGMIQMILKFNF